MPLHIFQENFQFLGGTLLKIMFDSVFRILLSLCYKGMSCSGKDSVMEVVQGYKMYLNA